MENESKREKKRNSAKKSSEYQVYTQKHIRCQEKTRPPKSVEPKTTNNGKWIYILKKKGHKY